LKPINKPNGIILCGGQSSRMGQNKALMKLGGITLIEHVINALKPICSEIILSVNNDDLNFLPHQKVNDLIEGIGPIAGFYSSLKNSNSTENIIVSCDMPFISSAFLQYLLQQLNNFDIVLPIYNNKIQTVTGIFSKKILPDLKNQITLKNFVPVNIFEKCNTLFVHPEEKDFKNLQFEFFNINTIEDYHKAIEIYNTI